MKKGLLFLLLLTQIAFGQINTGTTKSGKYQMNIPDLGVKKDSAVVWDGNSKLLKYVPISSISSITNLDYLATPTGGTVFSSSGNDAVIPIVTTTNSGLLSPNDKAKLNGIATGATANQSDVYLLTRNNHTGFQEISTITGLQNTLDGKQEKIGFTPENVVNKASSLAIDGTGIKYPTVDAVNSGFVHKTGGVNESIDGLKTFTSWIRVANNVLLTGGVNPGPYAGTILARDSSTGDVLMASEGKHSYTLDGSLLVQAPRKYTLPNLSGTLALTTDIQTSVKGTGTATAGQVSFWSGAYSQIGDDNLFWNNTKKILGIGTTAPNFKLHLHESDVNTNAIQLTNSFTGSTINDGFITAISAGGDVNIINREYTELSFYTNNTRRLQLTRDGALNLGVTVPNTAYKLQVESEASNIVNSSFSASSGVNRAAVFRATSPSRTLDVGIFEQNANLPISNQDGAYIASRTANTPIYITTHNGTAEGKRIAVHASGGVSIGNVIDLGAGTLNVTGNISTIAATTANQVVIKSQLDAVAATSGSFTPASSPTTLATLSYWTRIGKVVTVTYNLSFVQGANSGFSATLNYPAGITDANIVAGTARGSGIIQYTPTTKFEILLASNTASNCALLQTGTLPAGTYIGSATITFIIP